MNIIHTTAFHLAVTSTLDHVLMRPEIFSVCTSVKCLLLGSAKAEDAYKVLF